MKSIIANMKLDIKRNGFDIDNIKSIIGNMKLDIERNGFDIGNIKSIIGNMKQVWRRKWHNFRF